MSAEAGMAVIDLNASSRDAIAEFFAEVALAAGPVVMMEYDCGCEVRVKRDVLDAYTAEVDAAMEATVWTGASCKSWYQNPDDGKVLTLSPFSTLKFRSDAAPPRDLALFDCVSRHQRL